MRTIRDADLKRLMVTGQVAIILALLVANHVAASHTAPRSATPLLSPEVIARRVAAIYGEKHPRVIQATATTTDNSFEPMYSLVITGHFVNAHIPARYVAFSALADTFYAWGICGYNNELDARTESPGCLWVDDSLP